MGTAAGILDPHIGAQLIDTAGTSAFAPLMLRAANDLAQVDEIFAYRATNSGQPQLLLSVSRFGDATERAQSYVQEFFRFDPVTRLRQEGIDEVFKIGINASELTQPRYRSLCFDGPHFDGKLCYGWRGDGKCVVLSFYRANFAGLVEEEDLTPLANIALSILSKAGQRETPFADRLEHKLAHRFPQLTRRERQICARTVAGWTAEQSAAELGIRPASVITYRQRAYQRLGFRNAHDFLPLLVH